MARKIILLCSSFPPEKGAAPNRMYQLALLLIANNYEVTVLCAMPNYPTGKIFSSYKRRLIVKEKLEGINIIRLWMLPTNSSNKLWRFISLASYTLSLLTIGFWQLGQLSSKLVYISSPPFVTGTIGSLMAKLLKKKIILNISDIWPQSAYDLGFIKDGLFYKLLKQTEQSMYRRACVFTVQSDVIKSHIKAKLPDAKVFVYRNLSNANKLPNSIKPTGKRTIVYAGLLGIAQGVLRIIEQINFEQLGTELHIYGQGYEALAIEIFVSQNPNRGVYFHYSVEAAELPKFLANHHAMLIPLCQDITGAVPSKIFTAIAAGVPILFSGNGEAATIVQDNKIGLVSEAGNMTSLVANIKILTQLPEPDYVQMCTNSFVCGQEVFNKEKQGLDLLQFLDDLV